MKRLSIIKKRSMIIILLIVFFIISMNITVKATETSDLDCDIEISNIPQIGNVINIISNENSKNTSITVTDIIQFLQEKGIIVSYMNDIEQNSIDSSSTNLVGTGYTFKASSNSYPSGLYTIIVYGDATGDGRVDAADMAIIINDFLGTNTNISKVNRIAGDIQKDGELNAADLGLMVNSFVGNLQGSILKENNGTTEENKKKLSEVVQIGDYVDYPVEYKTAKGTEFLPEVPNEPRWRVLKKDGEKVYLVSNSTCFTVDLDKYSNYYNLCNEINNNFAQFAKNNDSQYGANAYLDPNYATITRVFNNEDVEKYLGIKIQSSETYEQYKTNDLININQMYGLWKASNNGREGDYYREYILGVNFMDNRGIYEMGAFPFGVRTVVELKSEVFTSGKDENGVWKLIKNK